MAYNNLGTQYELLFEKNIEPLKISVISSYLDYSQNAAIVFLSLLLTVVVWFLVSLICQIEAIISLSKIFWFEMWIFSMDSMK